MIVLLIKFYQRFVSPMLPGNNCRFYPSCSQYALEAFEKYPLFKALRMSVKRVLSCHPYHAGGYDPVP